MFSNNEEEDLFKSSSGSNLASLFSTSVRQDPNTSLTYTAPKQPRTNTQELPALSPKSSNQSSVICSKFVTAFKLLNGDYISVGKCGMAIIGSESQSLFEVIIYKTKRDILSRSKLRGSLTFTIQYNNFLSFFDDQETQWSIHFENENILDEFTKAIKNHDGTVVLLNVNSANVCNKNPGSFYNTTTPDSLGESKNYDSVSAKDSDSSDNSNSKARKNILTRMARMGQSILPTNLPKFSEQTDSELDDQANNKKVTKKRHKTVTIVGPSDKVKNGNNQSSNMQSDLMMVDKPAQPTLGLRPSQTEMQDYLPNQYSLTSIPKQMLINTQALSLTESLHVFIAENRTHNCELRMNMNNLSSKLDNVLLMLNKNSVTTPSHTISETNLEMQISEKNKELEDIQEKITQLQDQNSALQTRIDNDKQVIEVLKKEKENESSVILKFKKIVEQLETEKSCLEDQLAASTFQHDSAREALEKVNALNEIIEEQNVKLKQLQEKETKDSEINIDLLNKQLEENNLKLKLFSKKLKYSMNFLFQEIMEEFNKENTTFKSEHIKEIISQHLKSATLEIIKQFQNDFKINNQQ